MDELKPNPSLGADLKALCGGRANGMFQACWIVESAERSAQLWARTFGVGPFFLLRDVEVDDYRYRGMPSSYRCHVALAQAGDMQIELIEQPHDLPSVYRDLVPAGRTGFHHVGVFTDDLDRELAIYDAMGCARAAEGRFGKLRFAYVDTSPDLGFMIEILEEDPDMRAMFKNIAAAARGWNGERPVRGIDELEGE